MTVEQLIEQLQNLVGAEKGVKVVMSIDAEGNGFKPLSDAEPCLYVAETPWSGDIYDHDIGEDADDPNAVPAICLWPKN